MSTPARGSFGPLVRRRESWSLRAQTWLTQYSRLQVTLKHYWICRLKLSRASCCNIFMNGMQLVGRTGVRGVGRVGHARARLMAKDVGPTKARTDETRTDDVE